MPLATAHPYTLQLPDFAGPLDLLLRLIEKDELQITTISLAVVADQYLAYVRNLADPDPLTVAEFLAIAAQLLLIKSRALLPRPEPPAVISEEDSGEQLARQLREYQRFKHAASQLREWETEGRRTWERLTPPPQPAIAPPSLPPHNLASLVNALSRRLQLLTTVPEPVVSLPAPKVITLAEVVERLHQCLLLRAFISFEDVLNLATSRAEVIVTLWAVLELFKRQIISIEQAGLFATISIGRGERFGEPWRE
jgi:segregation and condensation protein A